MISRKSVAAVRQAMWRGDLASNKGKRSRILITRQQVADWLGVDVADVRTLYSPRNQTDTEPAA